MLILLTEDFQLFHFVLLTIIYRLGENMVTISLVQPTLALFGQLLSPKDDDSDITLSLKTSILSYLEKHFKEETASWTLLSKCSFVDPRLVFNI